MSDDPMDGIPAPDGPEEAAGDPFDSTPAGRRAPRCPTCGVEKRFAGGKQIQDIWSERYVCPNCGRDTFRSYTRDPV